MAPASARRKGARCPGVTLCRKGGPRAAPTGLGVGADLAGAEGGLGVPIRTEEETSRVRTKGKAWGCLGVQTDGKGGDW